MLMDINYTVNDLRVGDIVRIKSAWPEGDTHHNMNGDMDHLLGSVLAIRRFERDDWGDWFFAEGQYDADDWWWRPEWVESVIAHTDRTVEFDNDARVRVGDYVYFSGELCRVYSIEVCLVPGYGERRTLYLTSVNTGEAYAVQDDGGKTAEDMCSVLYFCAEESAVDEDHDVSVPIPTEQELIGFLFGVKRASK